MLYFFQLMLDFDHVYQTKSNLLINSWSEVNKKILILANNKKRRNLHVKTCLEKFNKFINTGGVYNKNKLNFFF